MRPPEHRTSRRFVWIGGAVLLLLAAILFALGSLNVPFIEPDRSEEMVLLYVLSTLVFLSFVVLGMVLARSLLRLYAERRRQVLGTKFKTKVVLGTLTLSLLPAITLFFVSYALVNRTLAKWFPRPLEIVRDDARDIVGYLLHSGESHAQTLAQYLADDPFLRRYLKRGNAPQAQAHLHRLAERHQLVWAALTNPSGKPLAVFRPGDSSADFESLLPSLLEPRAAYARTLSEDFAGQGFYLARVRVENARGETLGAVVVAQKMPADLHAKAAEIEIESQKYAAIAAERKTYRWVAMLILLLITGLVLFAGTWAALYLSKQVTVPIQALAQATREVSRGNFDHRVKTPAQDELGTLVDSFNQMTAQLGENRRQLEVSRQNLEAAVTELEQRRRLMEAILESIPTGVVTLSRSGDIVSHNPAVERLAGHPQTPATRLEAWFGPESAGTFEELLRRAAYLGTTSGEMAIRFRNRVAHLAVTVSALLRHGQSEGFVVVLDDLTELLRAQKAAAWQEVAQCIAHEIKNPLTPIQLSADRVRRYIARQPEADPPQQAEYRRLIADCAAQIAQEVNGLKTLVDEFSQFARFPAAQLAPTHLNRIVESTLTLYQDATNGIIFCTELAEDLPEVRVDADLLRRALANLIDNAADAMTTAPVKQITICTRNLRPLPAVELSVADTGPGIPAEAKRRLFLPFFSTKAHGRGLGLAIVDRIVAEHHGVIRVEDNEPTGTRVVIELPTVMLAIA